LGFALLPERFAQPVQTLSLPPLATFFAQPTIEQSLGAHVLQEQNRCDDDFRPGVHRFEALKLVLRKSQRRLQFLEEQLDLPTQCVEIDDLTHAAVGGVSHQDFDVVGSRFFQVGFHCRKNELHAANAAHLTFFLIGVVNARFHFRPNTPTRQSPVTGILARRCSKPDGLERQTRPILQTRTQLRAAALRSFVNTLRVSRKDPRVSSIVARFAHDLGIVGRIAQHDHFGLLGQRQAANQFGCRIGRGAVLDPFLRTVFFGVVRNLKRNATAGRGNQQAKRKAMALLAVHFLAIVAAAFLGTPLSVPRAVGVLRLAARLAGQSRIDDEEKFALAAFQPQQGGTQRGVEIVLLPARSGQKTRHLPAMNRLRGDAPRGLRATHASSVTNESQYHSQHHVPRKRIEGS